MISCTILQSRLVLRRMFPVGDIIAGELGGRICWSFFFLLPNQSVDLKSLSFSLSFLFSFYVINKDVMMISRIFHGSVCLCISCLMEANV